MRHDRAGRSGSHVADQIKTGLRSLPRTTHPIALRGALAFVLAMSFLVRLPAATPALAASVYFNGYGVDTYATFGPNATVAISGDIEGGCIDLFGQFSTYVFTAPHGSLSVGSAAPATPNAVITSSLSAGLFDGETIGFTAPDGKLGPGDYDVAMTLDCGHQTIGYVAGSDQPHGAFSVVIPVNVSNLPRVTLARSRPARRARRRAGPTARRRRPHSSSPTIPTPSSAA